MAESDDGVFAEDYVSAFEFSGTWREFAPIAFTNLLLTIVTLGVYRFWATTRERRYLWSRSSFIREPLEWTGTGMELFIGFLIALALFGIPFFILNLVIQGLLFRGEPFIAGLLVFGIYILLIALVGVARFRALRYRLSRTNWRGIRGGSDDPGLRYGWSSLWKYAVGLLAMGFLIPWSMVSLWNERWGAMSFGPHQILAGADFSPIMKRFLLFYLFPFVAVIALVLLGFLAAATGLLDFETGGGAGAGFAMGVAGVIVIYGVLGLIAIAYYAAFFRQVVGAMTLSDLEFSFEARTKDWFKLILGDIGLVLVTFGVGIIFLSYRHWSFFIRHMEASGEISLDALTQSTTRALRQGEGLLDAFDVGAI